MSDTPSSAGDVIAALGLEPHSEGGFFRETFRAVDLVDAVQGRRASATAIAFLLTVDRPSRFHRLLSDELWVHQGGAPLELWLLEPLGGARSVLLGPGVDDERVTTRPTEQLTKRPTERVAARPTARVAAHVWQAARVVPAAAGPGSTAQPVPDWSLVTCVVTPGFEYSDFELGRRDVLSAGWPQAAGVIGELT